MVTYRFLLQTEPLQLGDIVKLLTTLIATEARVTVSEEAAEKIREIAGLERFLKVEDSRCPYCMGSGTRYTDYAEPYICACCAGTGLADQNHAPTLMQTPPVHPCLECGSVCCECCDDQNPDPA